MWLTGLSGSGKSTLAMALERSLVDDGVLAYVLDGDNLRHGLCSDLGFSAADRKENVRRAAEVAALFVHAGVVVITAFISPFRAERDFARERMGSAFAEVFVDPGLACCEQRDPKGLYRRARAGALAEFTGISSPYEEPLHAELRLDTGTTDVSACVRLMREILAERGVGESR